MQSKELNSQATVADMLLQSKKMCESQTAVNRQYLSSLAATIFMIIRKRWALDSVSTFINHMAENNCHAIKENFKGKYCCYKFLHRK
jgi:hypothetical protein